MANEKMVTHKYLEEYINNRAPLYPNIGSAASHQGGIGSAVEGKNEIFSRFSKVNDIQRKMEFFERENKKYKKLYNRCKKMQMIDNISTGMMVVGMSATTTGVVTAAVGVTIPISLPTTIVGGTLSGTAALVGVLSKYSHSKESRYITLIEKSYQAKKAITTAYHLAMKDFQITNDEYNNLSKIHDEYITFKQMKRKETKQVLSKQSKNSL